VRQSAAGRGITHLEVIEPSSEGSKEMSPVSAARPSQASLANTLAAVIGAGLVPGLIQVAADGSYRVEIVPAGDAATAANKASDQVKEPKRWGAKRT